jgi:hypothetical protein
VTHPEAEEDVWRRLSRGPLVASSAVAVDESESELGQVLLLGGQTQGGFSSAAVHKVHDLVSGVYTPQPSLLSIHGALYTGRKAARLADGRIVCVGKNGNYLHGTAQVLEPPPPEHGSQSEASWQWRYLPGMSVGRAFGRACVLSDGRFAVFGGATGNNHQYAHGIV